eukprot:1052589-Pelagomonas_calceolata.AAC.1
MGPVCSKRKKRKTTKAVNISQERKTDRKKERKKERLRLPSPAACIKERSSVLKGRAPPHRPRGRGTKRNIPHIY